ncbi:hypothetical protein FB565_000323 [Actinoplanes lutulentus]|uniref:Uncharacterized protein n=1 Tax=Actinoplanes lutulentus TaxID=1287878 RepID=A0A327ZKM3_9ACTN|nr:hypothetical protein [Actinoplanes lutulentus]MBB2940619.1 hypothetical protein [Actinoplanes lutulentus]RAK42930.1 hypothetical protein B0I29_10160 [Actinoplanes lutulentus]
MTTSQRVHLAILLSFFTVVPLGAAGLGAVAFWDSWSHPWRWITIFLIVMFAVGVVFSGSIAFDRRLRSIPWLRIGAVGLFLVLGCGVTWARNTLQ